MARNGIQRRLHPDFVWEMDRMKNNLGLSSDWDASKMIADTVKQSKDNLFKGKKRKKK